MNMWERGPAALSTTLIRTMYSNMTRFGLKHIFTLWWPPPDRSAGNHDGKNGQEHDLFCCFTAGRVAQFRSEPTSYSVPE